MSYKDQIQVASQLVRKITIPVLPDAVIELQQLFEKSDIPDPAKVKRLISANPYIAGELIGLANMPSLTNSLHSKTKDLDGAIFRLGNKYIKNYVMAIVIKDLLKTKKVAGLSYHSQAIAEVCSFIAKYSKQIRPDEAYLVGLLHDIGAFALAELDEVYGQVFVSSLNNHYTLEQKEVAKFGTSHSAMGYVLAMGWSMPKYIAQSILLHHTERMDDISNEKLKLFVAMLELAHAVQIKNFDAQHETRQNHAIYEKCQKVLNLSDEELGHIQTQITKQAYD